METIPAITCPCGYQGQAQKIITERGGKIVSIYRCPTCAREPKPAKPAKNIPENMPVSPQIEPKKKATKGKKEPPHLF